MNNREDVFDEYEILRDAFGGEGFGEKNSNHEDPNEQALKILKNLYKVGEPIYSGNIKYT